MIQRIQSLYLSAVCMAMFIFLKLPIWEKVGLDSLCTIMPYALIICKEQSIIFPYSLSALLACCLALTAAYAIIRHDSRKLQLRLTARISLTLVLLIILTLVLIKKANTAYMLQGYSSYKIGIFFPFIALTANLLARYYIKKDEQLVNQDRLR
ncbi:MULTISPECIES: DUF4293 family protein [unclassified Candidatus Cardinium]|uniref:DUF4293 family protein n=1 Tax=unclassified Candidatus Cardinium TaxID=2641185 RepID=UPI001FB569D8|nr:MULTISPECIES: DUF4293 family protein [unclassified Candidatus Cardinium]